MTKEDNWEKGVLFLSHFTNEMWVKHFIDQGHSEIQANVIVEIMDKIANSQKEKFEILLNKFKDAMFNKYFYAVDMYEYKLDTCSLCGDNPVLYIAVYPKGYITFKVACKRLGCLPPIIDKSVQISINSEEFKEDFSGVFEKYLDQTIHKWNSLDD